MQRNPHSHKGQNGIVTVIGGSRAMHGAPVFAALAAEATGVDLIHPCVPACHEIVTRTFSPNCIVHTFSGDELDKSDVPAINEVLKISCAAVIGPGLSESEATQKAAETLIKDATIPLVVDASALQPWTIDALKGKPAVLTPHAGELKRMGVQSDDVGKIAKEHGLTFVLKGETDHVTGADGKTQEIKGGNAGLTKGGTGDALAGLIAGLIALRIEPFEAGVMATTIIKRAAKVLEHEKGYAFTTMDVIGEIPHLLHTYE